jgi:hypothetical protein
MLNSFFPYTKLDKKAYNLSLHFLQKLRSNIKWPIWYKSSVEKGLVNSKKSWKVILQVEYNVLVDICIFNQWNIVI